MLSERRGILSPACSGKRTLSSYRKKLLRSKNPRCHEDSVSATILPRNPEILVGHGGSKGSWSDFINYVSRAVSRKPPLVYPLCSKSGRTALKPFLNSGAGDEYPVEIFGVLPEEGKNLRIEVLRLHPPVSLQDNPTCCFVAERFLIGAALERRESYTSTSPTIRAERGIFFTPPNPRG